ncbi:MAG: hypothetical protein RSI33_04890 [Clostridia bacterium]
MPLIELPDEAVLNIIKELNHKPVKRRYCHRFYYFAADDNGYVFSQDVSFWTEMQHVFVRLEVSDELVFSSYPSSVSYEMVFADEAFSLLGGLFRFEGLFDGYERRKQDGQL